MNLDPEDTDARHALYNALFATMGIPTPRLPLAVGQVSHKYFKYGERALQSYRDQVSAIASVVARFAAEDAS